MNREIKFNSEARCAIKNGMDDLIDAVGSTLGPQGQCVVIGDFSNGQPHITKDGVTVAKNINFSDNWKQVGVQLLREAALKMVNEVGDGTTTTTVLAGGMIDCADIQLAQKYNPNYLKKQINQSAKLVLDYISTKASPIKDGDIEKIATISANNDETIGKLVADAFNKVTENGVIVVEESKNTDTTIEIINGMQFDRGYCSPYFITDEVKNICELENPYILITEQKIESMRELMPILEQVHEEGRSLLIIAEKYDSEVIESLQLNKMRGVIKICAITAPFFGEYRKEMLDDIAILTNGTPINYESGLYVRDITIDMLGQCNKVIVTRDTTTIIEGKTSVETIKKRVELINERLKETDPSEEFMYNFLRDRRAKLIGGVAKIYVGGITEMEMKERKDRVDDAVCATKAAVEEGIVPGGGITYLGALNILEKNGLNETPGGIIVMDGLFNVFRTLLSNGGYDVDSIIDMVDPETNLGYDAKSERIVNMLESGIVDPAKATRLAFENAISVVNLYLSISCVAVKEPIIY